jgi:hypothetical protein
VKKQLELFPRQARKVVACSACGGAIVVCEVVVDSQHMKAIYSEYQDAEGRCWDCSKKPAKNPVLRKTTT